jgi:hypothetical protein
LPTLRREGAEQGKEALCGIGPGGAPRSADSRADTLRIKGWTFESFHDKMVDSFTLDAMQEELCAPFTDYKMHVPAMNFGFDVMRVSHAGDEAGTGVTVAFNAKDALAAWSAQHGPERTARRPLQLVQVPYAKGWVERSRPRNLSALSEGSELKEGEGKSEGEGEGEGEACEYSSIDESMAHRPWDWTFSSDYCGTVGRGQAEPYAVSLAGLEAASVFDEHFLTTRTALREDGRTGVDLSLLRQRDVPILFYDEVLL